MKKQKTTGHIEIVLGDGVLKCDACKHVRKDEPYAVFHYSSRVYTHAVKSRCWRCCRDAESTLLIKQKWPIAFSRRLLYGSYQMEWSPGVAELVGEHEKA